MKMTKVERIAMASFLNNPRVVIPMAIASAIFIGYRVAPTSVDRLWSPLAATPSKVTTAPSPVVVAEVVPLELSRLSLMLRERWLPGRWRQFSTLQIDPFVKFKQDALALSPMMEEDDLVVIDIEMLDSYIAEHIGLDESGFFVRFGTIRKREGDALRTTQGADLVVGSIAMAEQRRKPEEHAEIVGRTLASLRLSGVMSLDSGKPIRVPAQTPSSTAKGFREGEVLSSQAVQLMRAVKVESSAFISGGRRPEGIYAHGDLVTTDPALGLSSVSEEGVLLVDRYGNSYVLPLH